MSQKAIASSSRAVILSVASMLMTLSACAHSPAAAPAPPAPSAGATSSAGSGGSTGSARAPADSGDWVLPAKDPWNTRYSVLREITPANVSRLTQVWSYETGIKDGHEGQPIVKGNRMWVITPFPNELIAFDITNPRSPRHLWTFTPKQDSSAFGKACCDRVNRGGVYYQGKIIYNTLDNHTVAVDAERGRQLWSTNMGEVEKGETMTMAPLLVGNKVIVGNSGGDLGVRGWAAALDASSGRELWRAFSTGSDSDVRIGPDYHPYYDWMKGQNLGTTTWPPNQWKLGGGNAWGWVSYDPESNLIYYGTANPGVWNPDMRPGDNLYSTSVWARDPDTGMARWAYQFTPHDEWDYDAVNEMILADLPLGPGGALRKVLVHFDRNGFGYTMDRTTGQLLVATPFVEQNWALRVDMQSGKPVKNPDKEVHAGSITENICPSSIGGKDQQPAAFSPQTGLFYVPFNDVCMNYGAMETEYIAGTPYLGAVVRMFARDATQGGIAAWNPATGQRVWTIDERFPVWSGALTTAGGLVFYGTQDGDFKAVDARTGTVVWSTHFDSGVIGNPIAFTGADGHEYVAVYSGVGGWYGAIVPGKLSTEDPYAALGVVGAAAPLKKATEPGGAVHIFALP